MEINRMYERGQPVTVLVRARRHRASAGSPPIFEPVPRKWPRGTERVLRWSQVYPLAPMNVLIRRADGTEVVRPLRGLRREDANA